MYYLAYGSNLHPARLADRLGDITLITTARIPGFGLEFSKSGQDGSGKCHLESHPKHCAYGAVYELSPSQWAALDVFEGDGYARTAIPIVPEGGSPETVVTFLARSGSISSGNVPFGWYLSLVLLGAQFHRLPADYLTMIRTWKIKQDNNRNRSNAMKGLVTKISNYNDLTESGDT